jgi:hypothetical protein
MVGILFILDIAALLVVVTWVFRSETTGGTSADGILGMMGGDQLSAEPDAKSGRRWSRQTPDRERPARGGTDLPKAGWRGR